MANALPRPQDGGWTDVALTDQSSPTPASSSPPEPVDIASGDTTNTLEAFYFTNDDNSDESTSSDALAEFDKLDEQLRMHCAPVVQPEQPGPTQPFPFTRLPLELREQVYDNYFRAQDRLELFEVEDEVYGRYAFEFGLLRTSKQVWLEAVRSWRKNVFVRIENPWPHAVHHIASQGQVPIIASGGRADLFNQHTGLVQITAPLHGVTVPDHTIILLLEDLPKFTKVWYYSALNYANLNPQICLTFTLRDPYYPADPKPIPSAVQRQLLLPFGDVKGLYETEFGGYDDEIVEDLRTSMAVPYPTVRECCETATRLLEEGDRLLTENKAQDALDDYIKSFDAIHIKISGRTRRVLADGFFADDITAGHYAGQAAMTVRVILRIRLVARVIHAYLRLKRPDEAAFWGMRTIKLMREGTSTDMDDFFTDFMGSSDAACIHAYTAIALTLMENNDAWEAERESYRGDEAANCQNMWRRAGRYLKAAKWEADRKSIVEEARRCGVRVPAEAKLVGGEEEDMDSMRHLDLGAVEG